MKDIEVIKNVVMFCLAIALLFVSAYFLDTARHSTITSGHAIYIDNKEYRCKAVSEDLK